MRRLSGMDAMFLYNEVPTQPMHTLKLAILDPGDEYSFERAKREVAARLHRVPALRWRAVPTPLGLNHPLMIEDPGFDLDLHFHRAGLPAPSGQAELEDFVSELAGRPLDRTRPLWEMWMVEGLRGGQVACVMKVHHTLADGVATAEMLRQLLTRSPDEAVPAEEPPWRPEAVPSRRRRLWLALRDLAPFLWRAVPALVRSVRATRKRKAAHAGAEPAARAYRAPDTSLNGVLSSSRSFHFGTLSFEAVRSVKDAFHATVNDVVLAAVSGALRRYLLERDDLPREPLVATIPVSTRAPDERAPHGNRVGAMYVNLCTHIEDPLERLQALQRAIVASKREFDDARGAHLADFLELIPPPLARFLFSRTSTLMKRWGLPSQANAIVSNVPGPREALFWGRTQLRRFVSIGPVLEGIGLNVTVWSYSGELAVGVLTDRRMLPDPRAILELMHDALEDLTKLASEQRHGASAGSGGSARGER